MDGETAPAGALISQRKFMLTAMGLYALGAALVLFIGLWVAFFGRTSELFDGLRSPIRFQRFIEAIYYSIPAAAILGAGSALVQPLRSSRMQYVRVGFAGAWLLSSSVMMLDGVFKSHSFRPFAPFSLPLLGLIYAVGARSKAWALFSAQWTVAVCTCIALPLYMIRADLEQMDSRVACCAFMSLWMSERWFSSVSAEWRVANRLAPFPKQLQFSLSTLLGFVMVSGTYLSGLIYLWRLRR
jgi:hypothetical protein